MKKITSSLVVCILLLTLFSSCEMFKKNGGGFNLFTIAQDKELGDQVASEIAKDPKQYPLVDSTLNPKLYQYVYKIRNKILNSGKLLHRNDFPWTIKIIDNDTVLNAFCTPGGHIYVYTGLMKYLDSEDELAGVLGHEIAHADMRHSTQQMTTTYGLNTLLSAIAGDKEILKTIASGVSGLTGLKFSRTHEEQADSKSVEYLCPTDYNANAGGKFFQKLVASGQGKTIEFLSTHPSSDKRIENYNAKQAELGCVGKKDYKAEYAAMKKNYLNKIIRKNTGGWNIQTTTVPGK